MIQTFVFFTLIYVFIIGQVFYLLAFAVTRHINRRSDLISLFLHCVHIHTKHQSLYNSVLFSCNMLLVILCTILLYCSLLLHITYFKCHWHAVLHAALFKSFFETLNCFKKFFKRSHYMFWPVWPSSCVKTPAFWGKLPCKKTGVQHVMIAI
jgi:hypothetical protein